jgi:hypothetical protein
MFPLFMILAIFLLIYRFSEDHKDLPVKRFITENISAVCYLFATFASVYVFIFSKGYSKRFLVIAISMLLISIGITYSRISLNALGKSIVAVALIFGIAYAGLQYATGLLLIRNPDQVLDIRTVYTSGTNDSGDNLFAD